MQYFEGYRLSALQGLYPSTSISCPRKINEYQEAQFFWKNLIDMMVLLLTRLSLKSEEDSSGRGGKLILIQAPRMVDHLGDFSYEETLP